MERNRGGFGWESIEELGVGRDAETAVAESIRAKVCVCALQVAEGTRP